MISRIKKMQNIAVLKKNKPRETGVEKDFGEIKFVYRLMYKRKQVKLLVGKVILMLFLLFALVSFSKNVAVKAEDKIWDGSIAVQFSGGSGTEDNPYQISNAPQLALLLKQVNEKVEGYSDKYYVLTDDIYLNDTTNWEKWNEAKPSNSWIGIGRYIEEEMECVEFSGSFDGKGHAIYGLYGEGLFIWMNNATIKNVNISKSHLMNCYGSIACVNDGEGIVENCNFYGNISINNSGMAGIVGFNHKKAVVRDCEMHGNIIGSVISYDNFKIGGITAENRGCISGCISDVHIEIKNYQKGNNFDIGGIVGFNWNKIDNCSYNGIINSGYNINNVGGITGYSYGEISNCTNSGTMNVGKNCGWIGGISGGIQEKCVVDSCHFRGTITCGSNNINIGGIVGHMSDRKIINCYNTGKIVVDKNCEEIGGIVGYEEHKKNNEISNCYNKGKLICKAKCSYVGGIAGESNTLVNACYNDSIFVLGKNNSNIGGICGAANGQIANCNNLSNISGSNCTWIGGIVGSFSIVVFSNSLPIKIVNCYNLGTILGDAYIGGIAGYAGYNISNSYNAGQVKGCLEFGGIVGRRGCEFNNCYYLKGCVQNRLKTSNRPVKGGKELSRNEMQSSVLLNKLNSWVKKKKSNIYFKWQINKNIKGDKYPCFVEN